MKPVTRSTRYIEVRIGLGVARRLLRALSGPSVTDPKVAEFYEELAQRVKQLDEAKKKPR
jgi:hypothetical protein